MIRYIIKRAALAVGIIFSISLITFFILNVIPGDPVAAMLGEFADADKIAQVKAQMGLDTPLPVQYFNWLKDLLHGDMGTSYFQKKPVITLILQAFHYTVIMATAAYIVALIVGLTTGILAAVYHDRPLDRILMSLSALGISAPSFWVAIILQIYVGLRFDIFPVSGVTRASMLEVTGQDFVKTAYAKGLYSWRIILIHIFQNALVPIITVIGTDIGALLTGSMITENVFNIPGIGKLLIDAIHRRDIPLVQGGVIYVAAICVLIYFIVDILYAVINPNIRLTKGE